MNIEQIISTKELLEQELKSALSNMEKKDTIYKIRQAILKNQSECPHYSTKYNWVHIDKCPYCGKPDN